MRARRIHRDVERIFDRALGVHGLTGPQMTLLAAIELMHPVPSGSLGSELGLEKSTVSRNLRLMEEKGWLRLTHDGKRRLARLTSAGRRLLMSAQRSWEEAQTEAQELLGSDLVRVFAKLPATSTL